MIFVSGATGFLGSHLVYHLLKNTSEKIRILSRKSEKETFIILKNCFSFYNDTVTEIELERIEYFQGDILDIDSLNDAFIGVNEIYHAAAFVSFNSRDKKKIISTNVDGTANMVNAALKNNIAKFCHVSSIAALGKKSSNELIDEETYVTDLKGRTVYSRTKYLSEMEVWRGISEGLHAVILNPSVVLGPGNWNVGSPQIFSTVNKGMKFYTKGVTGYVDVRDVCKAAIKLMNVEKAFGNRYILNATNISYQELFNNISVAFGKKIPSIYANSVLTEIAWRIFWLQSKLTGKAPTITKETARISHSKSFYTSKKIREAIDFEFFSIEETIDFTVRNFQMKKIKKA